MDHLLPPRADSDPELWDSTPATTDARTPSSDVVVKAPPSNDQNLGQHADGQPTGVGRLTAAEFTTERYVRNGAPRRGWRRLVYRLSGGMLNLGLGAAEAYEQELLAAATIRIRGCRRIAVISRKGGVGKTTSVVMLGHTFASVRGDRVVALDGNPDAGSLGYRIRRETTNTITDLLRDEPRILRYADIRGYTSQALTRLEVVASDDDPRITEALGEADYRRAIGLLERHYNLILLDTGTGILESATKGILEEADQLVVVLSPGLDSARGASATLDWLEEQGHTHLVAGAVAVLNHSVQATSVLELDRVQRHFTDRCRAVVEVPWDAHLAAGAETTVAALHRDTRLAYLELAAAVGSGFTLEPRG